MLSARRHTRQRHRRQPHHSRHTQAPNAPHHARQLNNDRCLHKRVRHHMQRPPARTRRRRPPGAQRHHMARHTRHHHTHNRRRHQTVALTNMGLRSMTVARGPRRPVHHRRGPHLNRHSTRYLQLRQRRRMRRSVTEWARNRCQDNPRQILINNFF